MPQQSSNCVADGSCRASSTLSRRYTPRQGNSIPLIFDVHDDNYKVNAASIATNGESDEEPEVNFVLYKTSKFSKRPTWPLATQSQKCSGRTQEKMLIILDSGADICPRLWLIEAHHRCWAKRLTTCNMEGSLRRLSVSWEKARRSSRQTLLLRSRRRR